MKAKDYFTQDMAAFFCADEFADSHTIDGTLRSVIIDNDRLRYRSKVEYDGVLTGDILFYAQASIFEQQLRSGDRMKFDGDPCTVFDVRDDVGMLEIILQRNVG